jgi:hypothetical protein
MRYMASPVEVNGAGCGCDHNVDVKNGGHCTSPCSSDVVRSRGTHLMKNVTTLLHNQYEFLWATDVLMWMTVGYRTA